MPVTDYETLVCLALNKRRAAATLAQAGVIAGDVLADAAPPIEWYLEEYEDEQVARTKHVEAQLRRNLRRAAKRGTDTHP